LDPLATGVLVCCLGRATKAIPFLMDTVKIYRATIDLASTSNTDDLEGTVTSVSVAAPPTRERIEAALTHFQGEILQVPPIYSAIQIDGKRAYKLARQGKTPELKARPVRIDEVCIESYDWPELVLTITCGKGTYIRSLARDLGAALGTGGMLTGLIRTRVGDYSLDLGIAPDALKEPVTPEDLLPIPTTPPAVTVPRSPE
ncbi:MAG: tRNA pseudouridine(55) synthase TruB, partial [Phycisphaerales bacterium]|nr:tRNA pseudouridine(55) synthase TruB [Phycisphaerales bacterium]